MDRLGRHWSQSFTTKLWSLFRWTVCHLVVQQLRWQLRLAASHTQYADLDLINSWSRALVSHRMLVTSESARKIGGAGSQ